MSTNSQGVAMNESILPLVAAAGPYFGRETAGPVKLNRQVVNDGMVTIGTPTVTDYGDSAPLDSTTAAPPPKP